MAGSRLTSALMAAGLDEQEARVYLAALSLGPSSAAEIAVEAGVRRTTIYPVLESLEQRGIVTVELKSLRRKFVAAPPAVLRSLVVSRLDELDRSLQQLADVAALQQSSDSLKVFKGAAAVRIAYEELLQRLRPNDFYLVISDLERWQELDRDFFTEFVRRRAQKILQLRLIVAASVAKNALRGRPGREQLRLLPPHVRVGINLVVTPARVLIHQLTKPNFAVALDNPQFVSLQSAMFEIVWASCREAGVRRGE